MKLEPPILSWLQPRKNNYVPTELDISISAFVSSKLFLIGTVASGNKILPVCDDSRAGITSMHKKYVYVS